MLRGVYEGVKIRPNTAADAITALAWSRQERARHLEVAVLAAAALGSDQVKDLYEDYVNAAVPTRKQTERDMEAEMADFDSLARAFNSIKGRLTPLKPLSNN